MNAVSGHFSNMKIQKIALVGSTILLALFALWSSVSEALGALHSGYQFLSRLDATPAVTNLFDYVNHGFFALIFWQLFLLLMLLLGFGFLAWRSEKQRTAKPPEATKE